MSKLNLKKTNQKLALVPWIKHLVHFSHFYFSSNPFVDKTPIRADMFPFSFPSGRLRLFSGLCLVVDLSDDDPPSCSFSIVLCGI